MRGICDIGFSFSMKYERGKERGEKNSTMNYAKRET